MKRVRYFVHVAMCEVQLLRWTDVLAVWHQLVNTYPRRLRRLLMKTRLAKNVGSTPTQMLAINLQDGSHQLFFELRGYRLSITGFSDLVIDRPTVPKSLAVALLQRNSMAHGCAWGLLRLASLQVLTVNAKLDMRSCNLRQFCRALEAILEELVRCREVLNLLKNQRGVS